MLRASVASEPRVSRIYVLAGTNGAGKSSIGGAMLSQQGAEYFNPDIAAAHIRAVDPNITQQEAESTAWSQGKRLLEHVIAERLDYAFETTLGGNTIPALLEEALLKGIEVRIWYVGLASVELNIARVRSRVARGGHDIPEGKIRERYVRSIQNLIRLLPRLTELRVYDNSHEADPHTGAAPKPRLILHLSERKIVALCDPALIPHWAQPVVSASRNLR
jgi:predicted ABC-type ATPase